MPQRLQPRANRRAVELTPDKDDHYRGQIFVDSGLSNGTHEATLVPWAGEVEGFNVTQGVDTRDNFGSTLGYTGTFGQSLVGDLRLSFDPAVKWIAEEALGERLGVAVAATFTDLRAAAHRVPRRVRPLDR